MVSYKVVVIPKTRTKKKRRSTHTRTNAVGDKESQKFLILEACLHQLLKLQNIQTSDALRPRG